ncbi:MAG: DUF3429 domain-containing protein [Thioalkalispiraceae bacterium]|jgi:hypothetical protein
MQTETVARILGYLGLIPFLILSMASWISLPLIEDPLVMLTGYAAVILSFMGAVHWGLAMRFNGRLATGQLSLSVIPALLGWLALLLHPQFGLPLLIAGFGLLCIIEAWSRQQILYPAWYLPLRAVLTAVVIACLLVALMTVR